MNQEPLIWTSKGNLHVSSLERKIGWDVTESSVSYWEKYFIDGEEVRSDLAVYQLPGDVKIVSKSGNLG